MIFHFTFVVCFAGSLGQSTFYERYKQFFTEVLPNNSTLLESWKQHVKNWTNIQHTKRALYDIPTFTCHETHPHPGQKAVSVHDLHPGDIRVIAAMGDSLTAGNGILASSILGDLIEYRGHSWSIGGDGDLSSVLTLPNIIKQFGQHLYGYSLGSGGVDSPGAGLNVAHPGDTSHNMPQQARTLIDKLRADRKVRYVDDWKVITLFIGGNDLCDFCNDEAKYSAQNYVTQIRAALDILHSEVPKAFINVVNIFDIAPIASMDGGFVCSVVHSFVCGCGRDTKNGPMLASVTKAYQFELEALIMSGRYDTRDDFTVVLQPFFKHTEPPVLDNTGEIDQTFFSPDCFHFSAKGHFAAALSLWNNMMEPVGYKQEYWHLYEPFRCPSTHDARQKLFKKK